MSKVDFRDFRGYDVVVAVNTLYWCSVAEAAALFGDIFLATSLSCCAEAAFSCLWNQREPSRPLRPGSTPRKRNSPASTEAGFKSTDVLLRDAEKVVSQVSNPDHVRRAVRLISR